MSEPLVTLRAVSKAYGSSEQRVTVLHDADLALDAGEVVLVQGRSGSGKTTLLNLLAGWQVPDRGTITWSSRLGAAPAAARPWGQVAVIPQALGLMSELTVGENVSWPVRLAGRTAPPHPVDRLMADLDIAGLAGRATGEVSLGEQQRAAVARALVLGPALVLADEPTAHQDAARMALVWGLFARVAAAGGSVLAASHSAEVVPFADRVMRLEAGRLMEPG